MRANITTVITPGYEIFVGGNVDKKGYLNFCTAFLNVINIFRIQIGGGHR